MTKVIVDVGSTHSGKIEYFKEMIDLAVECNCWAIKGQLGKLSPPNITLPNEWWPELVDYATNRPDKIEIFASVFDNDAVDLLFNRGAKYIKYAYSKRKNISVTHMQPIVSCPFLEVNNYIGEIIKLFCIPEYPVVYKIDFNHLFPPFDGFSDHTLGYQQTLQAIAHGAQYIEKHITLNHSDIACPDNAFALKPKELKDMMEAIRVPKYRI